MTDKRILIIEDEVIHARDLENQLIELGYPKLIFSRNAKEALPIIARGDFDLALVDIVLHDSNLDGIRLAKKIKELHAIPIIFLTGRSDDTAIEEALEVSTEYLVKPVKTRQLRVDLKKAFLNRVSLPTINTSSDCPFKIEKEVLYISNNSGDFKQRVSIHDIDYVRSDSNYTYIVTSKGSFTVPTTLKRFIEQFSNSKLVRVSRFYAVNKTKVSERNNSVLILANHEKDPIKIGRTYKESVEQHFETLKTN